VKLLFAKAVVTTNVSWKTLLPVMIMELERKSFLLDITYEGVYVNRLKRCHTAVKDYLETKHGIKLQITWDWAKRRRIQSKAEMQRLQKDVTSRTTVAMIMFGTKDIDHWSVVESISKTHLRLFDSWNCGPRAIRHMPFDAGYVLARNKQTVVGPDSLVTIKLL
jgi:hypothetical protein